MTAPAVVSPDQIIGIRYVRRTSPTDWHSHYLTRSWEAGRGGSRPAVCGARAVTWKPVQRFDDPGRYAPCRSCTDLAGIDDAPTAPSRIPAATAKPGPRVDPIAATPAAAIDNSHRARQVRRSGFLSDVIALSDRARHYSPK